jgi:hypothetical protein
MIYKYGLWSQTFGKCLLSLEAGPVLLLVHLGGVAHHPVQPVLLRAPALRHSQHGCSHTTQDPSPHAQIE